MIWKKDLKILNWLPRLQNHRGYWVEGITQNSLLAIKKSFELGYQMVEFDVRITKDNEVVLFHDHLYKNKKISEMTYNQLRSELDINTLDEALNWLVNVPDFKYNIEIKNNQLFGNQLEINVYQFINKYNLQKRVMISSFNPLSLFKMRLLDSSIYRALLLTYEKEHRNNFIIKSKILNLLAHPHMLNLRFEDFVANPQRFSKLYKKIPIVLWTVNDLKIWNHHKDKIHGIISDSIKPNEI